MLTNKASCNHFVGLQYPVSGLPISRILRFFVLIPYPFFNFDNAKVRQKNDTYKKYYVFNNLIVTI